MTTRLAFPVQCVVFFTKDFGGSSDLALPVLVYVKYTDRRRYNIFGGPFIHTYSFRMLRMLMG